MTNDKAQMTKKEVGLAFKHLDLNCHLDFNLGNAGK
jgi:hypothetical protein